MQDVPSIIEAVGLVDWYSSLSDMDKVKVGRYAGSVNGDTAYDVMLSMIRAAIVDENYKFAITLCVGTNNLPLNSYQRFVINEEFIEALTGKEFYEDAKNVCDINLALYPTVKDILIAENGGTLPSKLNFRNRYIDIIVGVEYQYDKANEMLDKYLEMGLIDADDLEYRKNSLRVHRLQRSFDGVYTYRPKE